MPDLLIELFSEEIPARMQPCAREDLKRLITDGLVEAGLTYASAGAFSTPRRLALTVEGLTAHSPTTREERKGPRTDAPEAALEGFLRSTGLTRDQLEARDDKKGQVWFAVIEKPGRPAAAIVAEVLEAAIRNFPWPKSMRWGAGPLRWVRPLHSILCILTDEAGAEIVPLTVEGITAGNQTRGHRFMAPDAFTVTSFEDYAAKLRRAKVMLDAAERADEIRSQAENLAFARGWKIVPDEGLLAEVAGLVEWPVPLMGMIEDRFLNLPPEVLQTSMKEHQKFFSALNPATGRIEGFVTVANIETPDDGATILAGNQRVLAARLSDAAFFWENDLREAKAGMTSWAEGLKSVTFQSKLGSQADRIERIAALAREIAPLVGADPDQAERAARLAKLDLRSAMVGEFPELQGTMGRYYALEAGEPEAVADAARDHYKPLGPSDEVPTAPVSVAVALADKLDTLAGFWATAFSEEIRDQEDRLPENAGEQGLLAGPTDESRFKINIKSLGNPDEPTSSKDPYALRRAALGVIRLILTNRLNIQLDDLLRAHARTLDYDLIASVQEDGNEIARGKLGDVRKSYNIVELAKAGRPRVTIHFWQFNDEKQLDVLRFLHDRLKVYLRERGIRHDIVEHAFPQEQMSDLARKLARATALNDMLKTEDGKNLTQGLKRAGNILAQAEEKDGVEYSFGADPKFAETDEERALFAALDAADPAIRRAMEAEDYPAAMAAIAGLRAPIDAFFEAVQVNADNQIVRRNRLNLLSRIREAGRQIADFSRIEG